VESLRASPAGARDERADAFTRLLDRSLDRNVRLATVVLGNRDDAEDALADATLRAWRSVRSLRDPAKFDAWFGRIVMNVCRDRLRERQTGPVLLAFEPPTRVDAFARSDERAALLEALAALTPDHRAVVALHYLEDMTVEQIAETLGARAGTVKSRLHYGVAELRAAYDAAMREPGRNLR
jgi:RNA polymerase sigma-70 factor (ECF subfamily)